MFRLFARFRNGKIIVSTNIARTFLSDAYKCTDAWQNRLNSPILQKVRVEDLYNTIDQKFSRREPVSAIDIDIFTNSISDGTYLGELRDLLYKLRLTSETGHTLDSTHYAAVRNFIDNGQYKDLIDILDDRLNYGIFLNEFTGNILLDELIKINDYPSAVKVASFFMLQENFENNEITENLCLYACLKYLDTLKPEVVEIKETVAEVVKPVKKKKEEEIKIRVRFLRNPFFDDHFDLNDLKLLAGKTLAALTAKHSDLFSINCQLIGWLYYKKLDKLKDISKVIQEKKLLLKDSLKLFKDSLEFSHIKDDPETLKTCSEILSNLEKAECFDKSNSNMEEILTDKINNSLRKSQEENIQRHNQLFGHWQTMRESLLKEQMTRLENAGLLQERKERQEELKLLDEKIWFFDNEEKFELKIDKNRIYYPKKWFGKKKKTKSTEEQYVPPEVYPRAS